MAKIYCYRCGADTGYTTASNPENRHRTLKPINSGEEHRIHLCSVCWDELDGEVTKED